MTAIEAEKRKDPRVIYRGEIAGYIAREVVHPTSIERDTYWSPIGDMFRCQLGRNVPTIVDGINKQGDAAKVLVDVFHLISFGPTMGDAVANLSSK